MPVPPAIHGEKYVSLTTFRKNGMAVSTPVWFAEAGGKLYIMSRSDSGKCKRLRNNSRARVAACTIRGKVTGPEFEARARILPAEDWASARQAINQKYWLARLPIWSKQNLYIEIEVVS
jgi:uncharacterized protein